MRMKSALGFLMGKKFESKIFNNLEADSVLISAEGRTRKNQLINNKKGAKIKRMGLEGSLLHNCY